MPESNWGFAVVEELANQYLMKPSVTGIEISFKEKDIKYLEFLFVYYMDMDDPIRKDHDWGIV
ncbi:hypothetical protein Lal_00043437 [Lupinus albus]|nr:hypothetical protein Lal_00043437 [Lupinus albus]